MQFRYAFFEMLNGHAVRLPSWSGYWIWENGTIMMHTKEGEAIDIRQTKNPAYTFSNIADNNWEVCEPIVEDTVERIARIQKKADQEKDIPTVKEDINQQLREAIKRKNERDLEYTLYRLMTHK